MKTYTYRAFHKHDALVSGTLQAPSKTALRAALEQSGYSLISASQQWSVLQRVKSEDLHNVIRHLEQFQRAGLPLSDSLHELDTTPLLRHILNQIENDITHGILFSDALEKHPRIFDAVVISLIRAGEKTGRLADALGQSLHYLTWTADIRHKAIKAIRYPLIMCVFLMLACGILLTIFVPELLSFMQAAGRPLPFSTRLLLWVSRYFAPLLLGLVCGAVVLQRTLRDHIPLFHLFTLTHLFHLFTTLWGGGIDLLEILDLVAAGSSSKRIKLALSHIESAIREGQSLSQAFQALPLFPPIVSRMVAMGEKTGTLGDNLAALRTYFDAALKRKLDQFISALEPALLLVVGLVMTWIITAIFLPLYDTLVTLE